MPASSSATRRARFSSRSPTTARETALGAAAGHGLAGMRERVAMYGGELESGPGATGGYVLRARLPVGADA